MEDVHVFLDPGSCLAFYVSEHISARRVDRNKHDLHSKVPCTLNPMGIEIQCMI